MRMIGVGMAEGLALFHISLWWLEPRPRRWLAIVNRVNYGAVRVGIDSLRFCDVDLAFTPDVGASRAARFANCSASDGVRFTLREVTDSVQSDRLLHGALSHRRCRSAACYRVPRFCRDRRIRCFDVAVPSRRDRNGRDVGNLESSKSGRGVSERTCTPFRKGSPVSSASKSGAR